MDSTLVETGVSFTAPLVKEGWDNPDHRLSMGIGVKENGEIAYANDPNDPMPIKTRNMAGLQKWEETDDYIIYVDKDAVMTTVQQYVTGTYDLFLERKANVDGAIELLRENGIEWTAEDDSKLLQDINLAQLERIANTPTTMDEPTEIRTFESRTVPTTYECCFRTDKKTGEIYIGEGYENLWTDTTMSVMSWSTEKIGDREYVFSPLTISSSRYCVISEAYEKSGVYTVSFYAKKEGKLPNGLVRYNNLNTNPNRWLFIAKEEYYHLLFDTQDTMTETFSNFYFYPGASLNSEEFIGSKLFLKNPQITKTETPKPFVRGVMPAGKLAFVTGATSVTHTELLKGAGTVSFGTDVVVTGDAIKQVLLYKGTLTEAELVAENEKEIRPEKLDFNPKSIKRYLSNLERFSGIKTYSQNLTEAEIVEEVSKDLVPLFRNTGAIPNSFGEVKEIEARVKVPAIGGAFDDDKKAGIYSSFWIDKNEKSNKIGTRIAWKK